MQKAECPNCGSSSILPIKYGYPTLETGIYDGITHFGGGCVVEPYEFFCKECWIAFSDQGLQKEMRRRKFIYEMMNIKDLRGIEYKATDDFKMNAEKKTDAIAEPTSGQHGPK